MRVIAGKFKGRILKMPRGIKIRPTSQKVKEARSRGAEKVFFVENNRICIKAIEDNLARLGIPYNYRLRPQKAKKEASLTLIPFDVERAIKMLYRRSEKFDFVFLDPPYYRAQVKNSLIKTCLYDILKPHSYVIVEHNKKQILPQEILKLRLMFTKSYGDSALSFYQKEGKR